MISEKNNLMPFLPICIASVLAAIAIFTGYITGPQPVPPTVWYITGMLVFLGFFSGLLCGVIQKTRVKIFIFSAITLILFLTMAILHFAENMKEYRNTGDDFPRVIYVVCSTMALIILSHEIITRYMRARISRDKTKFRKQKATFQKMERFLRVVGGLLIFTIAYCYAGYFLFSETDMQSILSTGGTLIFSVGFTIFHYWEKYNTVS